MEEVGEWNQGVTGSSSTRWKRRKIEYAATLAGTSETVAIFRTGRKLFVSDHTVRRLISTLEKYRKELSGIDRGLQRDRDWAAASAEIDLWENRSCETLSDFGADELATKLRKSNGTRIAGDFEENIERRIEAKETVLVAILNDLDGHSDFWKQKLQEKIPPAKVASAAASPSGSAAKLDSRDRAAMICSRLPVVVRQLGVRHDGRPGFEILDEYDVQDLLHALLRVDFDDIRTEEWTPSYAGGSARMDFLLKAEQIVIEAKMARKGHGGKQISDELIIDAARYREHPACKNLLCLVYDPDRIIANPRGVEGDLRRLSDSHLEVTVLIVP